jgi:hypothetical protein
MKFLRLLLFVPLLMAFQCEEDIVPIEDQLIETGLLGTWEIVDEQVNGIDDLLPRCCLFMVFETDENVEDLKGLFTYSDDTGDYKGTFTVDPTSQQITFQREDRSPLVYDFSINASMDYLVFSFVEQENLLFVQGWVKRE